jgi:stress-induced morphogen
MAITASEIKQLIQAALPDAVLQIKDLAGDGDHYAVEVVSAQFASKSRVQQHQMVYEALGGRVGGQLHALSIRTSLPPLNPTPLSLIESES